VRLCSGDDLVAPHGDELPAVLPLEFGVVHGLGSLHDGMIPGPRRTFKRVRGRSLGTYESRPPPLTRGADSCEWGLLHPLTPTVSPDTGARGRPCASAAHVCST
jgi:hypothetical protein